MRWKPNWRQPLVVAAAALLVAACGGSSTGTGGTTPTPAADVGSGNLTGEGSSFIKPFLDRAFFQYNQDHSKVTINYPGNGSGAGIQQITAGTVDFGASDVPMTASELQAAGGADTLVQIPATVGVVSVAYNLPGVDKLNLDGPTLARIFLGRITKWNDPALTALNKGAKLPDTPITVAHRSDGSGTTYAFTDYLAKQSPDWKSQVGVGKSVNWPVGVGGAKNVGVAQSVQQTEGSIGYVELAYVIQARMQQAFLKNKDGKFLQPSLEGATQAAAGNTSLSPTNFSITDEPGPRTYPIATYTWIILHKQQKDPEKGRALVALWKWVTGDGQQVGRSLQYAPLPKQAQDFADSQIAQVKVNGS
jgi:phosphate transport system substrate-binding protein